jgi:hypothetical protein
MRLFPVGEENVRVNEKMNTHPPTYPHARKERFHDKHGMNSTCGDRGRVYIEGSR